MGLKRCRLKDRNQRKLLKFFVAEVTAHAAADLMGIQVNTSALFWWCSQGQVLYYNIAFSLPRHPVEKRDLLAIKKAQDSGF